MGFTFQLIRIYISFSFSFLHCCTVFVCFVAVAAAAAAADDVALTSVFVMLLSLLCDVCNFSRSPLWPLRYPSLWSFSSKLLGFICELVESSQTVQQHMIQVRKWQPCVEPFAISIPKWIRWEKLNNEIHFSNCFFFVLFSRFSFRIFRIGDF